jgi:hypothetical protein
MVSVAGQDYGGPLEHVIVSEYDPALAASDFARYCEQLQLHFGHTIRHDMLNAHPQPSWWGHFARLRGLELATAGFICWLDDDDTYRPQHVRRHVEALTKHPEAGFSFSRVWIGPQRTVTGGHEIGRDEENRIHGGPPYPDAASIHGPQTFMHRRELTGVSTWRPEPGPDWQLVQRWLAAGTGWAFVDEVTVDAYQHPDYYEDIYGGAVA